MLRPPDTVCSRPIDQFVQWKLVVEDQAIRLRCKTRSLIIAAAATGIGMIVLSGLFVAVLLSEGYSLVSWPVIAAIALVFVPPAVLMGIRSLIHWSLRRSRSPLEIDLGEATVHLEREGLTLCWDDTCRFRSESGFSASSGVTTRGEKTSIRRMLMHELLLCCRGKEHHVVASFDRKNIAELVNVLNERMSTA